MELYKHVDLNLSLPHKSVVDRYFKRRYKTDAGGQPGEDHCILVHSNRICIVTLAPSHPIVKEKKLVKSVNFQVDESVNRLSNKVTGKGKRGAQNLCKTAALCHVTCGDDTRYTIYACLKSNLVEVNERLLSNPDLLTTKPETEGYIAITLTHLKDHDQNIAKLKSPEEYQLSVQARIKDQDENVAKLKPTEES